jgi:hypothetical protein
MSRIFRRVQFTDYLGELRAIEDIYDDNLPQPYPTGMTISGLVSVNFSGGNGTYTIQNTNNEGKWYDGGIQCGTVNAGQKPAYFVKDSDPRYVLGQFELLGPIRWTFVWVPAGFSGNDCGDIALGGSQRILIEYVGGGNVGTTSIKIGPYDYLEEGTYDAPSESGYTITYHY